MLRNTMFAILAIVTSACGQDVSLGRDTFDAAIFVDAGEDAAVSIGGPCATTYEGACQVQICLDGHGHVQTITRTPLDAGGCDE